MTKEQDDNLLIPLIAPLLLMFTIFIIDIQLPLGIAGGVPYIGVILLSLWFGDYKYVIGLAVLCSILTLMGFYFSPEGGELWKVLTNRALALFAIWVTTVLAIKWKKSIKINTRIKYDAVKKREKEKIYYATISSAQHITNNLLNQLTLVEMEVEKHPEFDKKILKMFQGMQKEASSLLTDLSSVKKIEPEEIIQSVYPKEN